MEFVTLQVAFIVRLSIANIYYPLRTYHKKMLIVKGAFSFYKRLFKFRTSDAS